MSHAVQLGEQVDERAELWDSILRYIDEHVSDIDLDPAQIAAAHYISVRSLHNLAQDSGTTISGWIRRRRLENCRTDLVDPLLAHLSVADIGARWGLAHPPHFTTLFRRTYGITPAAYRRAETAVRRDGADVLSS